MTTAGTDTSALTADGGSTLVSTALPLTGLIIVLGLVISPGAAAV